MAATSSVGVPAGLRWIWLGVAALPAQIWAIYFADTHDAQGLTRRVLLPLTLVFLLAFALRNWHLWGLRLMAVGFLLNLLVISCNGGLMPVSPREIASANLLGRIENVALGEPLPGSKGVLMPPGKARLWLLSDIIVLPPHSSVARVVSPGDLAIGLGLVITAAETVARTVAKKKPRATT